ncbi:protease complex subunit PrcB family protein [Selenihalanaerobacter shriftii]|uniref:PrcB C-terminal n=1 Tax=Selenihalanaerobacter shriftii TaxID=142842 RepID=A0A1T4LVT2_9FIRM|nr:protease complex subunit PrcB family protein [Selenihalanaerobacter shriftii]SJZ58767.1 PrcB C-terminal [Selenihalanaerobacter shriftii]
MKFKVTLLMLVVMILAVGCNIVEDIDSMPTIYEAERNLEGEWSKDTLPRDGEYRVVTTENREEVLKDLQHKQYYERISKLDLTDKVGILAYLGEMPSGGYGIQIDKVIEKDNKLVVKVTQVSPEDDEVSITVITHPYDLVVIDKSKFKSKEISDLDLIVVNQNGEFINK